MRVGVLMMMTMMIFQKSGQINWREKMKKYVRIMAEISLYFLSTMFVGIVFQYIGNKDVSVIQFAMGSTIGWFLFRFIRYMVAVCIHMAKDGNAEGKKS